MGRMHFLEPKWFELSEVADLMYVLHKKGKNQCRVVFWSTDQPHHALLQGELHCAAHNHHRRVAN